MSTYVGSWSIDLHDKANLKQGGLEIILPNMATIKNPVKNSNNIIQINTSMILYLNDIPIKMTAIGYYDNLQNKLQLTATTNCTLWWEYLGYICKIIMEVDNLDINDIKGSFVSSNLGIGMFSVSSIDDREATNFVKRRLANYIKSPAKNIDEEKI